MMSLVIDKTVSGFLLLRTAGQKTIVSAEQKPDIKKNALLDRAVRFVIKDLIARNAPLVQAVRCVRIGLLVKFVLRELDSEFVAPSLVEETVRPFQVRDNAEPYLVGRNAEQSVVIQSVVRFRTRKISVITFQDSAAKLFQVETSAEIFRTQKKNVAMRLSITPNPTHV